MRFEPARARGFLSVFLALIIFVGGGFILHPASQSASLTSASVTLSNPRLSFRGILAAGNTESSSIVTINTSSGQPSLSTAQLLQGDSVGIGNGSTISSYTVASSNGSDTFTITAGLGSGDADTGDDVISTQSADLTVRFTTANAIANGRFRILVPSLSDNTDAADGIPDGDAFDFSASGATIACPDDVASEYDFVSGVATASNITVGSTDYHVFECAYSGTGAVGTVFDGTGGNEDTFDISSLINPAPEDSHSTGTANSHQIILQHLDSSFSVQDDIAVSVGVIEAVKVTATVDPTISFSIAGVASSQTSCNVTTDVTTTAASVPFGSLSLAAFGDAAQTLTVSTNAGNGYSVTAIANDQLGLNGGTCSGDNTGNDCIRDSAGDNSTMAHDTEDEFNSTDTKGFAYSIENDDATTVPFEYNSTSNDCTGTYCARQFADSEDSQSAVELMSNTDVADNQNIDVCYRIIPAVTNSAGDYENNITYTATATF